VICMWVCRSTHRLLVTSTLSLSWSHLATCNLSLTLTLSLTFTKTIQNDSLLHSGKATTLMIWPQLTTTGVCALDGRNGRVCSLDHPHALHMASSSLCLSLGEPNSCKDTIRAQGMRGDALVSETHIALDYLYLHPHSVHRQRQSCLESRV
jgi:hypothetical protein